MEAMMRFSFEGLRSNIKNFQTKLGQGGFGTQFEGILCNGTKVAVKYMNLVGQGRGEFLVEVNTIGKLNHFILLRNVILVIFIAGICYFYRTPKKLKRADHLEEGDDQVIETLTRFSFEDLRSNTNNFQTKLGRGGFGTVFEGVLRDGTKVAVKCLDSVGQGRREFLAEVNTIGKVNHFNLVRLLGYCAKQPNRLLVYEYMCNGSLDKWIFNPDRATLQWKTRQKIIHGVAKGLEYLHECCSTNIVHFDIKPQNILLDEHFNAKISDFGLAKLIDRDQSLVLTRPKGTPGYLAPELFGGAHISVKADVYSFGIVILKIVCTPLIYKVREKAEKDRLCDLINEHDEDMHRHKEEAIRMIKIALWCLQTHDRRPSMSMIVKILEGSVELNSVTEYRHFLPESYIDFSTLVLDPCASFPLEASILSAPR
ncbi:Non-specific serine/threonine protein kinase [Bertholletia excelsa]